MKVIAIIPARMGSSRFPGKPMKKILGIPMIEHVYRRTIMSQTLQDVYVATCDEIIYNHITSIGGKAIMTSPTHERCSDRCAEAMLKLEDVGEKKCDIMVMIQGDEPTIYPDMIDEAIIPMLENKEIKITNLMGVLEDVQSFENPNEVKVVTDTNGDALYFSREPIPSRKKGVLNVPMHKQVCIIPFRRDFLLTFNSLPETPLEIIESVDMMRILEHGFKVKMIPTHRKTKAVDTPNDIAIVEQMLTHDPLCLSYLKK